MLNLQKYTPVDKQTEFVFKLDSIRTYRISKEQVAKIPRNLFGFNKLDESTIRKSIYDLEEELENGIVSNNLRFEVPDYVNIHRIHVVNPFTKGIMEAPALIMNYVPGKPANSLKRKKDIEREKKSFDNAIEIISFYFDPIDAYAPRNRIYNPITKRTTIVDLEMWKLR